MSIASLRSSRLLLIFVYLGVVLIRAPGIVFPGRFWAEEGHVYFQEAYTSTPWELMTSTNLGYYSLFNKIAALAAAHLVPLRFAPIVTMLFALAAQTLPVWLLLYSQFRSLPTRLCQIGAIALVLLVQPNQEVWLNTINSRSFLCLSTALILISSTSSPSLHIARLGALTLAGLTGVMSCLLLPLFWLEYTIHRDKQKLHEAILLTVVCGIQTAIVLCNSDRHAHLDMSLLTFVLGTKQWILPVLGSNAAMSVSDFVKQQDLYNNSLLALVALLPYLVVGSGLILWGHRQASTLFFASAVIATLSFLNSLEVQSPDSAVIHLSGFGASRYYYAPNCLLALALLMPHRERGLWQTDMARVFRGVCIALVWLMLFVGAHNYFTSQDHDYFFRGPSWSTEVDRWQEGRSKSLRVWPHPWSITLPRVKPVPD